MGGQLEAAAAALAAGAIVCVPTESTYGLAVDPRAREALARLAELKGRDPSSPFPLIAADEEQARSMASSWPPEAERLARSYWPGPLTLVVPARSELPPEIVGPAGGVGVRVSAHAWPRELARILGAPITATSANPSGQTPASEPAAARAYFGDRVGLYLDGGPCRGTVSTVVQLGAGGQFEVLRRGAVAVPEIDG